MAKIFRGYSVDIDYRLSARARPGLNMAVDKTMMMMRQAAIESANQNYMGDSLSLSFCANRFVFHLSARGCISDDNSAPAAAAAAAFSLFSIYLL